MDPNSSGPAIQARIVLGVTGHRDVRSTPELRDAVNVAIQQARGLVPPLYSTPLVLGVLSPLAEGADRLVARQVLEMPGSSIEAVLPMDREEYARDFLTTESKRDFEELLSRASSVKVLEQGNDRSDAYQRVGRYVVDQCDVLIALWDGKPAAGRGGTADVVRYARETACPLVWVNTDNPGEVTLERGRGLTARPFQEIDAFNGEKVDPAKYNAQLGKQSDVLTREAEVAGLPSRQWRATLDYFVRRYVRADILALRYQHFHHRSGSILYALAATAVAVAAFQVLFLPERPIVLASEVALMLAVLGIVGISRWQGWHMKWIDYRFLAERFRSAMFLALADTRMAALRPPRHLSLAYSPNDWIVPAFLSVWRARPVVRTVNVSLSTSLRSFISNAWIQDQINYHEGTKKRHHRRHFRLSVVSNFLFGLTLVAASLHVADIGPRLLETLFALGAISFPAIAASLTAIRTQRDYLRNSMRSAEMVRHLTELKAEISGVTERDRFLELVRNAEDTMLHENEDWRVVVKFHAPELPV